MKLRLVILILVLSILGTSCTSISEEKYSYEILGTFDSMIQIIGYTKSETIFLQMVKKAQSRFELLNKYYDIYNNYKNVNNIKTINDMAGRKPVKVSKEIIDLLLFSKEWYYKTGKVVNIAFGSVLSIWHDYRNEGLLDPNKARIPNNKLLQEAFKKTDIEKIIVDKSKSTVFLQDLGMKLNVGAIAKGYATELVAKELVDGGYNSFAISSGGNVKTVGTPKDGIRKKWNIGIQDPNGNELISNKDLLDSVYVNDNSVVTSGDYQRYYVVNNKRIHHIIDPKTLIPADNFRAVTIVTENSAVADFLSTSFFILNYSDGRKLAERLDDVAVLWVMKDGRVEFTENMRKIMKKAGGAKNE